MKKQILLVFLSTAFLCHTVKLCQADPDNVRVSSDYASATVQDEWNNFSDMCEQIKELPVPQATHPIKLYFMKLGSKILLAYVALRDYCASYVQ